MKILFFLPFLLSLFAFTIREKAVSNPLNDAVKGKWVSERSQIQFVVDSHLVHEMEVTTEKGKVYTFDGTTVQVTYPDGTSAQGTYSVSEEGDNKQITLQVRGSATTYLLIAITASNMIWQKDLEDVYYKDGSTRKSAERAIYTEVLKKQ